MVILPRLFLPPELFLGFTSDFSGLVREISSKVLMTFRLWPGVTGLNFLTAIVLYIAVEIDGFTLREGNDRFLIRLRFPGDDPGFRIP